MFNKNKIIFREVNMKYLYHNTLSNILVRRTHNFNSKLCKIKIMFWYKHIPIEEFNILRLYNHIMLIWLLFQQKCIFRKLGISFRLNVYYNRILLLSNVSKKKILSFFDIFNNGFLLNIRKVSIRLFFVNDNLIMNIDDLSFYTSIKVGHFFYIENVTDNLLVEFRHKKIKIINYLSLFKLSNY